MDSIEDLPDELLIMILNKLNNFDVLYSFVGTSKRFNKLIDDISYTRSIKLVDKDSNQNYCSLSQTVLDRVCIYYHKYMNISNV